MTTVIFSHGQESGPWGTKIRAMADLAKSMGCAVQSIDYQGIADPHTIDELEAAGMQRVTDSEGRQYAYRQADHGDQ